MITITLGCWNIFEDAKYSLSLSVVQCQTLLMMNAGKGPRMLILISLVVIVLHFKHYEYQLQT